MKCFVASAFDHKDVDAIFNKAIAPVLRHLQIAKLRVDRVEHNDDIDDKIFSLIDECDFCIADLTYARPSVYYEAGFVSGLKKPVIYISRRDHFRSRPEDPAGNLRVHFDLQMKNIIPWTSPDEVFIKRLRRRIKHICGKIKKETVRKTYVDPEHTKFQSLSVEDQLRAILEKGKRILFAKGFQLREARRLESSGFVRRRPRMECDLGRIKNGALEQLRLVARPSFTKSNYNESYLWMSEFNDREKAQFKRHRLITIYASLQPIRESSLRSVLSSYTPNSTRIYLKNELPYGYEDDKRPRERIFSTVTDFKSVSEFSKALKNNLSLWDSPAKKRLH